LDPDATKFSLDQLWSVLEHQAEVDPRYKVTFSTIHARGDCADLFSRPESEEFRVVREQHDGFSLYDLTRVISRSDIEGGSRTVSGTFGLYKDEAEDIWTAFTSEGPDFLKSGLIRFVESFRPAVASIHLTSGQLRHLFEHLEDATGCRILVTKAVLYSHREEGAIDFKERSYQELFNFAESEDDYVDKIEYELKKDGETVFHAFTSRDGISYYYGGQIRYLRDTFLPALAAATSRNSELFEHRERDLAKDLLKPLDIVYDRDVFTSAEDNLRLIRALANVDRSGLAVLHKNPYLHVSFLDFYDGATFDIFATGSNRISIIPGYRSSVHALSRITEQIFKDFQEGSIEEESQPEYSLTDFLSQ